MPRSYDRHYGASSYAVQRTNYADTPVQNYYARLSEKAAPTGTIHLNSYETSSSHYYRQPVYHTRAPSTRVVQEVVSVREPLPARVVHEKVVVKEPVPVLARTGVREKLIVKEPVSVPVLGSKGVVEKVVRKEDVGLGGQREIVERREVRERGLRGAARSGVGKVFKALGEV
ncbi:hypothetical protein BU23DRAFT_563621 [Bimuria novae-zelandiae CBS 107.79]|uniref:Uncharacterized protein n=1 Tax=Bimuria novae-zelandiae CBS 107.79 TaxID=1447943 RepID=A0A6A5VQ51_9PLEO|nr:hypothetical protein BU23DRAFT_563621 [Bimuria novae-zelandiae CBS 107.79]